MKIINVLTLACMTVAVNLTAFAQHDHGKSEQQKSTMGKAGDMMGKPTAEKLVDGVRVQFWLITQADHKKMMDERMKSGMGDKEHGMMGSGKDSSKMGHDMGGKMMGMDHSKMGKDTTTGSKDMDHSKMMEAMMAGTHHVMVKALDDTSGMAVDDGHVMIGVTAPSGKKSTVHLSEMMGHFGGGVSLDEKGSFKFNVTVKAGSTTRNAEFEKNIQ